MADLTPEQQANKKKLEILIGFLTDYYRRHRLSLLLYMVLFSLLLAGTIFPIWTAYNLYSTIKATIKSNQNTSLASEFTAMIALLTALISTAVGIISSKAVDELNNTSYAHDSISRIKDGINSNDEFENLIVVVKGLFKQYAEK